MRLLPLAVALLFCAASAAPFLGSRGDFRSSALCQAYPCRLLATVPSGPLDQSHYRVGRDTRVVVWRDRGGPVRSVSVVWYGHTTLTGEDLKFVEALLTCATGQVVPARTALAWLASDDGSWDWGSFQVVREEGLLPGTRLGILTLGATVRR